MININLLPVEYRVEEKAPVGFFLLVIFGIIFVSTIFFAYLFLDDKLQKLKDRKERVAAERKLKDQELKKLVDDEAKIQKAQVRQRTIVSISTSKIYWAEKLQQLSKIISKHSSIWVEEIQMREDSTGRTSGFLKLKCYSRGLLETNVSKFRKDILNDRSFFSVFDKIDSYRDLKPRMIRGVTLRDEKDRENLYFTVNLQLKKPQAEAPKTGP